MTGLRRVVAMGLLGLAAAVAAHDVARAAPAAKPGPVASAVASQPAREAPQESPPPVNLAPPKVYLFRGALGPIFSTGMDRLGEKIEKAGFWARVYEFTLCDLIESQVVKSYREEPAPIVLIGHSMGGLCSVRIAIALQEEHIPVSLVVAIDPAHATKDVPPNVQRFINIFLSDNILGGGDVKAEPGYRGHYASYDMKDHAEVTHINIDKMDSLHAQLVTMISQLAQTPATTEAEPLPLRYLVPPDASVELWDSGVAVFVRPGDTLEQMAANYHVPLWALQQANKGAGATPLVPGERIVIPRHLLPLPATATTAEATASIAPVAAARPKAAKAAAQPAGRKAKTSGARQPLSPAAKTE